MDQSCGACNAVQPGRGNKSLTEVDLTASGPDGLSLVRTYNSYGYFRPRGSGDVAAGGFGSYWRMSYDRRLHPLTGHARVSAIAHRPDGRVKYFDLAGQKMLARGGAKERLEAPDASRKGRDYSARVYFLAFSL